MFGSMFYDAFSVTRLYSVGQCHGVRHNYQMGWDGANPDLRNDRQVTKQLLPTTIFGFKYAPFLICVQMEN
jgi:hypothetical protein